MDASAFRSMGIFDSWLLVFAAIGVLAVVVGSAYGVFWLLAHVRIV